MNNNINYNEGIGGEFMNIIIIWLSVMMFFQFFIWGGWFVILGIFLGGMFGVSGGEIGMVFLIQLWGVIIVFFIIGLIVDCFFNVECILGILYLVGVVLMYLMYQLGDFVSFYFYVLGYMIVYMFILVLVNLVLFG